METNEKEKYKIPLDVQIQVLESAKEKLKEGDLLCTDLIDFALDYFPLLNFKNTEKNNGKKDNRINFVQWMIDETKKLQENENKKRAEQS